ncbi:transcription repressor NadR [Haloimpatiens sp. FM7330]|uniref:transcription repressor NadR n=1 Tax=Haloimpatiens sp. FM7330 TaxID=3298610 RepID=UPI00362BEDC7
MNSEERRRSIEQLLTNSNGPHKGHELAQKYGVTRQVIVKDIAILRAAGKKIVATPEGYMMINKVYGTVKKVLAFNHNKEDIKEELEIIIKYGGKVEDVIVEHPVYGEIRGILMIKNLYDIENFMKNLKEQNAKPLSILTGGVHLHTIQTEDEANMNKIMGELKKKNFLILD